MRAFVAAHPEAQVIRLGIGDVTEPLAPAIVAAMHAAVDEMGARATFRGYGPEQGYDFLLDAIRTHDYASRGVELGADEIFVSDGSKCDSGNLQELVEEVHDLLSHRLGQMHGVMTGSRASLLDLETLFNVAHRRRAVSAIGTLHHVDTLGGDSVRESIRLRPRRPWPGRHWDGVDRGSTGRSRPYRNRSHDHGV